MPAAVAEARSHLRAAWAGETRPASANSKDLLPPAFPVSLPPPALVEALHDRYVIERELGRGGMATVYLARDLRHDRHVALKVLHAELGASLGPERFLREIRLAARLQHPHILPVHESGETAGPALVHDALCRRARACATGCGASGSSRSTTPCGSRSEVARALDHAHRHGVIHRDIKPENILLTEDGDTLVADFGIGRARARSARTIGSPRPAWSWARRPT